MRPFFPYFLVFVFILSSCSKDDDPKMFNLKATVTPSESGTVSPATGSFEEGESVTLTATPAENYVFSNWNGDAAGSTSTISVTIDTDKNITASFVKKDTDGDGVTDDLDQCPNTANGASVDSNGCADNQIPSYIPTSGLAAWYPFNGTSDDLSGNANDGAVSGPAPSNDRFGNANAAFTFDGIDDYIEIADDASIRPQFISISLWFKTSEGTNAQSLLYKSEWNTYLNEQYSLALNFSNSPNQFDCSVKNNNNCDNPGSGWQRNQVTDPVDDNIWHHLVYTYDGGQSTIYIDGVGVSTQEFAPGEIDNCAGSPLFIGRQWIDGEFVALNPYIGELDDIGIWNRPLTATEVVNIYQSSKN